ncbi:MAG: glycerol-3-phosphate dehydrogenase [Rhodospirillales bacterium]
MTTAESFDLAIIGGGVNGCGIARDAAGRGLSVFLCEQGDLAQATSSASTKLIHGGLRYLEHYEFRLVRESLKEREVLLRAAPHIVWPLRFVLPHHKGLRPAWLLRLGLFVYDHLGGRQILPPARRLNLRRDAAGAVLKDSFRVGFEYSDCWVQDARLVVLAARDAEARGGRVETRTRCLSAEREGESWVLTLEDLERGESYKVRARGLVNAAGPWVEEVIRQRLRANAADKVRLVRGSHIVVERLFDHDRAYIFQNADGRICFAIPYEEDFTLIGTTDQDHEGDPGAAACSAAEARYLCEAVSEYLERPVAPEQVIWSFAGVRPLYDDGADKAQSATRDYVLKLEDSDGALPLLNIFGGKITTFRKLAEAALEKLAPYYPEMTAPWTATAALPGGDFAATAAQDLAESLAADYPFLGPAACRRLIRAYGSESWQLLGEADSLAALGRDFGGGLYEAEVTYLMTSEWAREAADVLWRRSKLGLRLDKKQAGALEDWMRANRPRRGAAACGGATA